MAERLLVPFDEARHQLGGVGKTKFHEMINEGHLERVRIGRRSFITARSISSYVNRITEAAVATV